MADIFHSKFENEFKITAVLGEGNYGFVFEAENKYDDWKYAVKRIAIDPGNKDVFDKALNEVRAMAQLDHPGIVRYNGTWFEKPPKGWQRDADRRMLTSIGWWSGPIRCIRSLCDWLDKNRTQSTRPIPRMMFWFKQMVSAVGYIHENGLIHRDLKPENVLFVDEDRLKICDLRIATKCKIGQEEMEITRTLIGTEEYMSPEQRAGLTDRPERSKYSLKADVFTLGLILVELCLAMTAEEKNTVFHKCRRGNASMLNIDPTIADFVVMLTKKAPEERPTCKDILNNMFIA